MLKKQRLVHKYSWITNLHYDALHSRKIIQIQLFGELNFTNNMYDVGKLERSREMVGKRGRNLIQPG